MSTWQDFYFGKFFVCFCWKVFHKKRNGVSNLQCYWTFRIPSGVFPVGVAKYLTWPETSWTTRVTCTHHLWTIPLLLTASGGVVSYSSYFLSLIIMITNVSLSRLMIPNELRVGKKYKYLNVNLSHELWKDINIEFLRINYDNPPCLLYLFRLLSRWQMFNTLCFGILIGLCEIWFAGSNHVCKQ